MENILSLHPHISGFFVADRDTEHPLEALLSQPDAWQHEQSLLIILFHYLPQLRTFKISADTDIGFFLDFMRRVATGYQIPGRALQMPLQHLQTAAIAYEEDGDLGDVAWVVYFMCVPSLRTFAGFWLGTWGVGDFYTGEEGTEDEPGDEDYLRNTEGAPVSNVEELVFAQCRFDSQSLNTILPMTKNLRSISYVKL
ncbi:hypothetical protein E8E13_001347 [Curvularia kusanoi]|uniref:Uncharacterized protein n=1 Tax=Curvularia kusanoi TaxID=90978 RepID=A0A9P4T3S9_CURKU|nr:hypothetical protein E8E13_001347 [Curvularia kusanoi]